MASRPAEATLITYAEAIRTSASAVDYPFRPPNLQTTHRRSTQDHRSLATRHLYENPVCGVLPTTSLSVISVVNQVTSTSDRQASGAAAGAATLTASDELSLRHLIRQIVREEIAKENAKYTLQSQAPPQQESTVASVAEVNRHELRQAFASPQQYSAPPHRPNSCTYADAVRHPLAPEVSYQPNEYSYADAVSRPTPMPAPQYLEPYPVAAWTQQDSVRRPYMWETDIRRTADR
ncbi:hypothetical protein HPB51_020262 [Rhipicephalus microplus]|uniref:Uncharacterized protein n=1 Tax=Rhipicephalus microplus TaxID=6941 RepID=A0A9J6EUT1_RHIMP|nr:hypothetical protein HPB51_020262 [Rhipicephalus microplus]